MSEIRDLIVAADGAQHFPAAASGCLADLRKTLSDLPSNRAGVRIHNSPNLLPHLSASGSVGSVAAQFLGHEAEPVRAILFDKTADTNWSLGWHQDRTICVRKRLDVAGFDHWTSKGGVQHVEPPFNLLSRMITLRVHLDDVPPDNSPLLIAPGSHTAGRVPVADYASVVARFGTYACLASAGDIWAYATPILHASEVAAGSGHRRVLQIDYSADQLTGGLEWLGI